MEDEGNERASIVAMTRQPCDTSDMTKQEVYQLQEKYVALQSKYDELIRENTDAHQNFKEIEVLIEDAT